MDMDDMDDMIFYVQVFHDKDDPLPFALRSYYRLLKIDYLMITGTYRYDPSSEHTYHDILTRGSTGIFLSRPEFLYYRPRYTAKLAQILTYMDVPEFAHAIIINAIFSEVALSDNPDWPVDCKIMTYALYPQINDNQCVTDQLKCCEKVRIDSLEGGDGQKQCVICWETLDHIEGAEEGTDCPQLIRLPCSHLYHEECIFRWLKMSALCPMCQHSLPILEHAFVDEEQSMPVLEHVMEEVAKPSEPSWRQLQWPMLLTATAGGMLTAMLVYRLLKQSQG